MKKIITILSAIILLSGLQAQAAPVTSDRALEIAKMIFGAQHATKAASGSLRIVWDGEPVATKAAVQPAFYVIARDGGGFVIIAGDDNVRPVLAISDNGRFSAENMPENVQWWMDGLRDYVRSASTQSPETRALWDSYVPTKAAYVTGVVTVQSEHRTPEWDQGNNDMYYYGKNVFNTLCPTQNGQLTITGCVATALGELLTYQSGQPGVVMPTSGTGTVGGYSPGSGYVAPAAYNLSAVYDWAALRTLTDVSAIRSASESALQNVGRLLADLGAIMEAAYSTNNTGAVTSSIPAKMGEHFYMNKGAHMEKADNYTPSRWVSMLKAELDLRPLIYNGTTASGAGHAFIFDGYGDYDGDVVFHVNFGWSGSNNGYYYPFNLDAGGSHNYSYGCGAIFDFYPDVEGVSTYSPRMLLTSGTGPLGLELSDGSVIRSGDSFVIRFGRYSNEGSGSFIGKTRISLVDKYGAFKAEVGEFVYNGELQPGWGFTTVNAGCYIPGDVALEFGDKIILEYQTDAAGTEFAPVEFPTNGSIVGELPVMPAAIINTDRYSVGDYFQFQLANNNYVYSGTRWKVTHIESGDVSIYPQSLGEIRLERSGAYQIVAEVRKDSNSPIIETIVAKIMVSE